MTIAKKRLGFYYGWVIVAISFVGDLISVGSGLYAFSVFLKPMAADLGLSRTLASGVVSLRSVLQALLGPVAGTLVDKHGPRYIMAAGGTVTALGLIALSFVSNLWQFYLVYGVIGAIGTISLGGLVGSATVSKWFVRKRGRALAIASMGISVGGMIMIPVSQWGIDRFGWRTAWVILGVLAFVLSVPAAAIFMRRMPEDIGLLPDGDAPHTGGRGAGSQVPTGRTGRDEVSWTPKDALRTRQLWLLIISVNLGSLPLTTIMTHQVPHLTDLGISTGIAAAGASVFATCALISKIGWGFLAERVHVRYCIAISYLGTAIGIVILINADTVPLVFAYAVVYGLSQGGFAPLTNMAWADYYGRTFVGTIRGITAPISIVTSSGGPFIAGLVFDLTNSYTTLFSLFIAGLVIGSAIMVLNAPPKRKVLPEVAV